jgi:glycerophosphoryl diester phosphodiesterase
MQMPLWTEEFQQWKFRTVGKGSKTVRFFFLMKYIANPLMKLMSYHLRKRGILTFYWVCNYENDFKKAIDHGACGIMTDNPATLSNYLEAYHKKLEEEKP